MKALFKELLDDMYEVLEAFCIKNNIGMVGRKLLYCAGFIGVCLAMLIGSIYAVAMIVFENLIDRINNGRKE